MYMEGITNSLERFERYGDVLGTIMEIDKVFGFVSFISTILIPLLKKSFG